MSYYFAVVLLLNFAIFCLDIHAANIHYNIDDDDFYNVESVEESLSQYAKEMMVRPGSAQKSFISCATRRSLSDNSPHIIHENLPNNIIIANVTSQQPHIQSWVPMACKYRIQHPYNTQLCQRYAEYGDVKDFLIYSHDHPFSPNSPTLPRTEMRVKGCDMITGQYRFDGQFMISCGSSGVTFFQIFEPSSGPSLMIRSYLNMIIVKDSNGQLSIGSYACNRYHSLAVFFDADARSYNVSINDMMVYHNTGIKYPNAFYYYKLGACTTYDASDRVEVFYKNTTFYTNH